MKKVRTRFLFAGWMLAMAGFAVAEPVDPRFPSERIEPPAEEWAWWLPSRIRQIEMEQDQLLEKISVLPQHDPTFLSDHLGYHSLPEDSSATHAIPPHTIDIDVTAATLGAIALVPAFSDGVVYAFPKRFKIEVLNKEKGSFKTVVDWMEEDFPDPGPYPVFFSEINQQVKTVRVTVPAGDGETDSGYFALGEIYLFSQRSKSELGANIISWGKKVIHLSASDSFEMSQFWDLDYLSDGVDGFGLSLSEKTVDSDDFLVTYKKNAPRSTPIQFILDLGRVQRIGRIEFWPAAAPIRLAVPTFGFPMKISAEISRDRAFKTRKMLGADKISRFMYRGKPLTLIGKGFPAQYIRVTVEGLDLYRGEEILGFGEILVSNDGHIWSVGCPVRSQGIPEEEQRQLSRLTDGFSRQRRILPLGYWIKGLAQRRPLDRRLASVELELEQTRIRWRNTKHRMTILGGGMILAGLVGGLVIQRRQRYSHAEKLREQIGSDLHDDIGSKVAAIALASTYVEKNATEASVRRRGTRIQAIANGMHHGLRNVLWLTDMRTDTLDHVVQKLVDCARIGIPEEKLVLKTTPIRSIAAKPVDVQTKRDLLLFFEEALHNAVTHSKATEIRIEVLAQGRTLRLVVHDNGTGFNLPSEEEIVSSVIHHGLRIMHERSKRLRGRLRIQSELGEGTTVALDVTV